MNSGARMRNVWLAAVAALMAMTSVARAQEPVAVETEAEADVQAEAPRRDGPLGAPALPLSWAERPLTLTAQTIRADGAFTIERYPIVLTDPSGIPIGESSETGVSMRLGGAYGITDDIEVGAVLLPLELAPEADYHDPWVYGLFRFLSGETAELGVRAQIHLPFQGRFRSEVGLPLRLHLGSSVRLDTGLFFPFAVADRGDDENVVIVSLRFPVELAVNVTPEIFLGGRTGLLLPDLADNAHPVQNLGFFAGYTVPSGDAPLADLRLHFDFPALVYYGAADADQRFEAGWWQLTFEANVYFNH